jgi:hypothetical protein
MGKIAHQTLVFRTKTSHTIRATEYNIRITYTVFFFLKKVDLGMILWDGQVQLNEDFFHIFPDLSAVIIRVISK